MRIKSIYQLLSLSIFISLILGLGCEKIIELDIDGAFPSITIDAKVYNDSASQVILSSVQGINETNEFILIQNAQILIQDEDNGTDYTFEIDSFGVYRLNTTLTSGREYSIQILSENEEFKSTKKMPSQVLIDSLRIVERERFFDEGFGNRVYLYFQDPVATRDFYRFVLSINGFERINLYFTEDNLFNGEQHAYEFPRTWVDSGDTIAVQLWHIDQESYEFYKTLNETTESDMLTVSPSNPNSSFDNAFGLFLLANRSYAEIIVP